MASAPKNIELPVTINKNITKKIGGNSKEGDLRSILYVARIIMCVLQRRAKQNIERLGLCCGSIFWQELYMAKFMDIKINLFNLIYRIKIKTNAITFVR